MTKQQLNFAYTDYDSISDRAWKKATKHFEEFLKKHSIEFKLIAPVFADQIYEVTTNLSIDQIQELWKNHRNPEMWYDYPDSYEIFPAS